MSWPSTSCVQPPGNRMPRARRSRGSRVPLAKLVMLRGSPRRSNPNLTPADSTALRVARSDRFVSGTVYANAAQRSQVQPSYARADHDIGRVACDP
jgi:hypothetical protein